MVCSEQETQHDNAAAKVVIVDCIEDAIDCAVVGQPFLIQHKLVSAVCLKWAAGIDTLRQCALAASATYTVLVSPDGVVGHYDPKHWTVVSTHTESANASMCCGVRNKGTGELAAASPECNDSVLCAGGVEDTKSVLRWEPKKTPSTEEETSEIAPARGSSIFFVDWASLVCARNSKRAEQPCHDTCALMAAKSCNGAPPPRHVAAAGLHLDVAMNVLYMCRQPLVPSRARMIPDDVDDELVPELAVPLWPSWTFPARDACISSLSSPFDVPRLYAYVRGIFSTRKMREILSGSMLEAMSDLSPQFLGSSALSVYASEGGLHTNLHCDDRGGLIAQLKGKKRVVLFPPSCRTLRAANWGSDSVRSPCGRRSWYSDGLPADWASKEPFKDLGGCEVVVEPGWALYTPPGWWHDVLSLGGQNVGLVVRCVR